MNRLWVIWNLKRNKIRKIVKQFTITYSKWWHNLLYGLCTAWHCILLKTKGMRNCLEWSWGCKLLFCKLKLRNVPEDPIVPNFQILCLIYRKYAYDTKLLNRNTHRDTKMWWKIWENIYGIHYILLLIKRKYLFCTSTVELSWICQNKQWIQRSHQLTLCLVYIIINIWPLIFDV